MRATLHAWSVEEPLRQAGDRHSRQSFKCVRLNTRDTDVERPAAEVKNHGGLIGILTAETISERSRSGLVDYL